MNEVLGAPDPLPTNALRWRCDPDSLGFASTAELEPAAGVLGQEQAVEALRFGLEIHAPGQNIYVRGLEGTGRLTTVQRLLEEIELELPPAPDYLYVHNFDHPDRPRLITVERGRGELLCEKLNELRVYITQELASDLGGEMVAAKRKQVEHDLVEKVRARTEPLERSLAEQGLALLVREVNGTAQPMILPLHEGKPVAPDKIPKLLESGALTREQLSELEQRSDAVKDEVSAVFRDVGLMQRALRQRIREVIQAEAKSLLEAATAELRELFTEARIHEWLDALIHDLVSRRLTELEQVEKFAPIYDVNPLSCHRPSDRPPVIVETVASMRSLIGTVDVTTTPDGHARADHTCVRAGSLVQADGGVLVLEARELLAHPGAWSALVRSLRSGKVELVLPERVMTPSLKPEPVPIQVKVVLIGDAAIYYALDQRDADFPHLFKVLADFDDLLPRSDESRELYARVIARMAAEEELPAFSAAAVAELIEHGARIAAAHDKLSARFGRLGDLAREAAFLARKQDEDAAVSGEHVREAVRRTKRRADLPARRFREQVNLGRICVCTKGAQVGQINGLAVISAGPLTYGFPSRITATLGTGVGGTINIEREAQLSGSIHTKGFYILGGLLRHLLRSEHPLSFEASIAFEQSYGGIDGDSASGAEIVCLLSALTDLPIRQDLAMTGAIDQLGNILPVGAVNEKIEGFYDTCKAHGLSGEQGVLIPKSNVGDLMLRHDVVEACDRGEFHVWAVGRIHEAISLFFAQPAGERDPDTGFYPEGSILHQAVMSAFTLWQRAEAKPDDFEVIDFGEDEPPN